MIPSTTGESHPSKYIVGDTGKLGFCVKHVVENEKISPLSFIFHSILFTIIDTDTVTLQPLQGYCEKVGIRTRDPLPRSHMHHQLATANVVFNPREMSSFFPRQGYVCSKNSMFKCSGCIIQVLIGSSGMISYDLLKSYR